MLNVTSIVVELYSKMDGIETVTTTDEFSLVCFEIEGAPGVGKFGAADWLTCALENPWALPISFSTLTTQVKKLPALRIKVSESREILLERDRTPVTNTPDCWEFEMPHSYVVDVYFELYGTEQEAVAPL